MLEVEGLASATQQFFFRLSRELPPPATLAPFQPRKIPSISTEVSGFTIRTLEQLSSPATGNLPATAILPDLAPCPLCLDDIRQPQGRRRDYPFTNCTQCGPRFSILESLPYDRDRTTMRSFELCPHCRREYEDPADRRFHAQPNACPQCGPRLIWLDATGKLLPLANDSHDSAFGSPSPLTPSGEMMQRVGTSERVRSGNSTVPPDHPTHAIHATSSADAIRLIREAVTAIESGCIVGLKGVGGFQLLADATNPTAVARLRQRKGRPTKPFALMCRSLDEVRAICHLSAPEASLLASPAAPIVLLESRDADNDNRTENWRQVVAPGQSRLGVMLPSSPLHDLLMRHFAIPLIVTSGNVHSEPICIDDNEAILRLGSIADYFLTHNREIARPVDDSVAVVWQEKPRIWRRARGYAPLPLPLAHCSQPILAMGGDQRSCLAIGMGGEAVLSQHLGDLTSEQAILTFRHVLEDLLRVYSVQPEVIAHDLHPSYHTTRMAKELSNLFPSARLLPVQHHHAHLAACLAEHEIPSHENACGVAWDGTGFGVDGTIWGGEFLVGNQREFRRVATWRPFVLLGGEEAIRHPRRIALALLWQVLGTDVWESSVGRTFPASQRILLERLLRSADDAGRQEASNPYQALTSSVGRLFDGLSAMLDPHQPVHFSGEAAMRVEAIADPAEKEGYPCESRRVDEACVGFPGDKSNPVPSRSTQSEINSSRDPAAGNSAGDSPWTENFTPGGLIELDWRPLFAEVERDVSRGIPPGRIAARFQLGLVTAATRVVRSIGLGRVVLSGGCFQNQRLTESLDQELREMGCDVLLHERVPPNDGGLSFGQLAVAAAKHRGPTFS